MRRLILAALAACLLLAPACKKRKPAQYVEEGASQLSSSINVADPRANIQLLRGFYDVENNAWRWTASKFAVALRPPKEPPVKVFIQFALPEVFFAKVPETTLTITVGGKALEGQKYTKPGEYRLERLVPPEVLGGEVLNAEFSLDHFLAPGVSEQRELGLIVSSIGLQSAAVGETPAKK